MAAKPRLDLTGNEHALIISTDDATHTFELRDVEIRTTSQFCGAPTAVEVVFRTSRYSSHPRGAAA
ncbi:hypothetical protein ACQPW1_10455 [Nocardia sp. CA-128927]|uniref:hypothetical protein n=1 Tax=Nocardia sp. CA-128927 TaxID=3239975 RepID=UPI003D97A876